MWEQVQRWEHKVKEDKKEEFNEMLHEIRLTDKEAAV